MVNVKSTDTDRAGPARALAGCPTRRGICAVLLGIFGLLATRDLRAQATDAERRQLERDGDRRLEERKERQDQRARELRQQSQDRYQRQEERRQDFLRRRERDRPEPFPAEPPPPRRR